MSTSLPPNSEPVVAQPPDSQKHKPTPTTQRRQGKSITQKLTILAALVILVLGYVCIASPSFAYPPPDTTITPEPTSTATGVQIASLASTPTPLATATGLPTDTPTPTPTATPLPGTQYVVIISIDGLRPDALDLADTPTLDRLRAKGAYCPSAQTVRISETLPGHASMLSGMIPEKHGVLWGLPYIGWPGMNGPTLFNVAHDAGLATAMVLGKEKLSYLVLPNSVDELFCAEVHDTQIKDQALEVIEAGLPHVLFVHFPDTDRVGHNYGWMSCNQLQSIRFVDGLIGEILIALENGGYLDSTLLIVTADHGGHGFGHGDDSPLDRTIPWLAVGPRVPGGVTLTRHIDIYDTAATALYALELPIPETWDGQPILEILQVPSQ